MAMTEREMLELAALAAGLEIDKPNQLMRDTLKDPATASLWIKNGSTAWNPLTDDGQALRLAVKLDMQIWRNTDGTVSAMPPGSVIGFWSRLKDEIEPDPCAAYRRAIVRAAAEIGRGIAQQVTPDDLPEDNYYKTQAEAFGYTQEGK